MLQSRAAMVLSEGGPATEGGRTAQYRSEFYDNGDSYMGYMANGLKHGRGVWAGFRRLCFASGCFGVRLFFMHV